MSVRVTDGALVVIDVEGFLRRHRYRVSVLNLLDAPTHPFDEADDQCVPHAEITHPVTHRARPVVRESVQALALERCQESPAAIDLDHVRATVRRPLARQHRTTRLVEIIDLRHATLGVDVLVAVRRRPLDFLRATQEVELLDCGVLEIELLRHRLLRLQDVPQRGRLLEDRLRMDGVEATIMHVARVMEVRRERVGNLDDVVREHPFESAVLDDLRLDREDRCEEALLEQDVVRRIGLEFLGEPRVVTRREDEHASTTLRHSIFCGVEDTPLDLISEVTERRQHDREVTTTLFRR